jgi:hypothetical protein
MCIYVLYSTVDIDVQVCLRKRAQASEIRRRFFFLTKTELVWLFGYATKKLETKLNFLKVESEKRHFIGGNPFYSMRRIRYW